MECLRCKTRNNYYHKFCYNCGAQLESKNAGVIPDAEPQAAMILLNKRRELFNPYKERKRNKKKILYAGFISAAVVAGVLCWIIANG